MPNQCSRFLGPKSSPSPRCLFLGPTACFSSWARREGKQHAVRVPSAVRGERGYNTASDGLHNAALPASARGDLHGEPRNMYVWGSAVLSQ